MERNEEDALKVNLLTTLTQCSTKNVLVYLYFYWLEEFGSCQENKVQFFYLCTVKDCLHFYAGNYNHFCSFVLHVMSVKRHEKVLLRHFFRVIGQFKSQNLRYQ